MDYVADGRARMKSASARKTFSNNQSADSPNKSINFHRAARDN